jgi:hypothetical protein
MASFFPSREGIAHPTNGPFSRMTSLTFPSKSTFTSELVLPFRDVLAHKLFPSPAQSMVEILVQPFSFKRRSPAP